MGGFQGGGMSDKKNCRLCQRAAAETQLMALPQHGIPYQVNLCHRCADWILRDRRQYNAFYLHQLIELADKRHAEAQSA
jgi:hypothetical protein